MTGKGKKKGKKGGKKGGKGKGKGKKEKKGPVLPDPIGPLSGEQVKEFTAFFKVRIVIAGCEWLAFWRTSRRNQGVTFR